MTASLPVAGVAAALELLLRATVLIGAAWIGAGALRKGGGSAAARHVAWLLGIAALLALPILWWLGPALPLPILPAEAPPIPAATGTAGPVAGSAMADSPASWSWRVVIPAAYALGAAALLLRLVVGRLVLARLWRDAAAAPDGAWAPLLSGISSEMLLPRRVELRIARSPVMPMTWGTLAPKLLLPAEAGTWSPERRRLVLLHELAHVARRDSLSRSTASLACALYWFHPGAWFAARQMRIEQEHAADDRVLAAGASAQAYALSLLDLARGAGDRLQPDLAAAMAGIGQLERRLVSITSPARRDLPGRLFLSLSAGFACLATLVVAAGVPVSPSSAVPTRLLARPHGVADARTADEMRASADAGQASAAPARLEPEASESDVAPGPRRGADASKGREGEAARTAPNQDAHQPQSGDAGGEASASTQTLRDYGWQLPRRDFNVQPAFLAAPPQSSRRIDPTPAYSTSSEPAGRPRWSQIVPRIVPAGLPGRSSPATHQIATTTNMLSWSIPVGAH